MRNYFSGCIFNTKSPAKFIDPDGNLRRVGAPAEAAELMLEFPGYVVAPAEELRRTRRISAMKAEEKLRGRKLYLMFPVARANCRVSDKEIAAVDTATCQKKKVKSGASRVFPEKERVKILEVEDDEGEKETGFPGHRLSNYRNWKPVLETIKEGS
ncbi:uncharacterized protein LOC143852288 [Tasmannia lanceolata]|uniref:uncharacterized protein LOC143852288 n=1 Tax=Tasmannia lanceolata TaxID=3420 RepID=UPI0040634C4A